LNSGILHTNSGLKKSLPITVMIDLDSKNTIESYLNEADDFLMKFHFIIVSLVSKLAEFHEENS
jgi:hypothetical protein